MKKLLSIVIVIMSFALFVSLLPDKEVIKPVVRDWVISDSKAYAKDVVLAWSNNQWLCLEKLWTKESNWRSKAYNKTKVMGKNAGGIPQLLGMSPDTNPTEQIDRGFSYIMYRYGTPCKAWKHFQRKGWY